ncbi:hypothetical protein EXIGLDRAFT_637795 [Exidia glandulosa HHB12029]|uniref:K Homology domain-containing protein n=1 Tax=Exidia glandulosa HHB12029 TaxID=1314781 RepID=A0A165PDJ4_EXIGL|nr:hypothetical protein EXIGLDRAFT_637795 [Exidia glandulosa HHB12029]
MDLYTTAFSFPRAPHQPSATDRHISLSENGVEEVTRVVNEAKQAHACSITWSKADHGKGLIFYLSGGYQNVMGARGHILRECPVQTRVTIRVTRSEVMDGSEPRAEFRRRLDEISGQTYTRIIVAKSSTQSALPYLGSGGWGGLETERMAELVVTGPVDCVEIARLRLLVLLDEMNGLHAEALEIDQKLHPIIASRKRSVIQSIQQETSTNIYFPNPLHGLMGPKLGPMAAPSAPGTPQKQDANVIWITGEFYGVQRARDMLYQVSAHKAKTKISADATMIPRKLDWMLTERAEDLRTFMIDNGTFISFPPVGSQTSQITVYGDHRVNINRTLRQIMQLSCSFYVASFWLLPMAYNPLMPQTMNANLAQMPSILTRIANVSGAELVFKTSSFELHGLEAEVIAGINLIFELDIVKNFHHEIRFTLELANEHRDFISGKKNGKINKITQTTNAKVKFETLNDHNFLIELAGNDTGTLAGLYMLQEELPAEISFHVPEVYHKRIIGVGGKSIQKIMKKWGVYVKFSNAEEFAALGGYHENEDNVVARTPAKNAMNLENLKQSVMEMVPPKDKDYVYEPLSIPRRYHRTLLGEKNIFIHDIETKTNSKVRFPDKENASDIVVILGPESQVHIAAAMLLDHVPFEAFLLIPPNPEVPGLCITAEFANTVERIRRDYQVNIVPVSRDSSEVPSSNPGEHAFKFFCQKSNSDYLSAAREQFEQLLQQYNIKTYPFTAPQKRPDSIAGAFAHFPSKLLSTPTLGTSDSKTRTYHSHLPSEAPDLSDVSSERTAHNQTPAYSYTTTDEYRDEENDVFETMADTLAPLPPSRGLPVSRTRQIEALKRGSDSALEAKLKNSKSLFSNRAISLDLAQYNLHHFKDVGSSLPPPSPTESTESNSSPVSGTAPSFPSVYSPPANQTTFRSSSRNDGTDEVTRAMGNTRL